MVGGVYGGGGPAFLPPPVVLGLLGRDEYVLGGSHVVGAVGGHLLLFCFVLLALLAAAFDGVVEEGERQEDGE